MRQEIGTAENDLPGKRPALLASTDNVNFVVGLLHLMVLGIGNDFEIVFHDRDFVLRINFAQDKGIVNMLWTNILQRLVQVVGLNIVAPDHKAILRWDPQLEIATVA